MLENEERGEATEYQTQDISLNNISHLYRIMRNIAEFNLFFNLREFYNNKNYMY